MKPKATCPFCAEPIAAQARICPHCRERLDDTAPPPVPKKGMSGLMIALLVMGGMVILCIPMIAIVAAIAIPNLIEARKHGNEAAAIGALKTISTSQSLFREGDKDGDEVFDYGTLQELGQAQLLDSVLSMGTKQGYVFQVAPSSTTPEFLWMAVASPVVPGTTGDRYFLTTHEGVVYYSTAAPFTLDTVDCQVPADAQPVGYGRRR